MKSRLILLTAIAAGMCSFSSCTKTYYIDRTVTVEPTPKPKPVSRAAPEPQRRPRVDDPDSFDAVTKPTTYSY
jgi:hypothetical protein